MISLEEQYKSMSWDSYSKRFANLLSFVYLIHEVTNVSKVPQKKLWAINEEYLTEKFKSLINLNFSNSKRMKKLFTTNKLHSSPGFIIKKFEDVIGKDSFVDIQEEPLFMKVIHPLTVDRFILPYITKNLPQDRHYKIWKLLNSVNVSQSTP